MAGSEQRPNTFEDDDMRVVISEIEEMDDEAEEIMASARGKVQGIRKRQKNRKKIAKDLGIPMSVLNPLLRQRKLERQLRKNADEVPEEWTEVFVDAAGQFSFFAPAEDEAAPEGETAAQAAARKRRDEAAEQEAQEQREGAAVLDSLTGEAVH